MTTTLRPGLALLCVTLAVACAFAADPATVQRIGPPENVPDVMRQAVEDKGYRVTLDGGWSASLWFARQLKLETKEAADALYPELSDGEFVAIVNFRASMTDYRGQTIPAGFYTLRYQTIPQDGNHLGVSPNPDFLLAIPVASDSHPEQTYALKKLVALSAKATGTSHAAVIALEAAGTPGTVTKNERGEQLFTVTISAAKGKNETLAIVLKGTAAQ